MSQSSVTSFFNTRKKPTTENLKKSLLNTEISSQNETSTQSILSGKSQPDRAKKRKNSEDASDTAPKKVCKIQSNLKQPKLVKFVQKGKLSPCKKFKTTTNEQVIKPADEKDKQELIADKIECGMKTPVKQIIKKDSVKPVGAIKALVKKELSFDEVKTKISRSEKLQELKASLNRIQELEKKRKSLENKNQRLRESDAASSSAEKGDKPALKEFDTIELEVLTSPMKFKTPTKPLPPPTPDKNELMSPKHTKVAKRILFSPTKDGSPSKMVIPPAYEKFAHLSETNSIKAGTLPLPFKYRQLIEIFKGLDSVCAMFYNRKECITFKKLKPVVQRMLRKNFYESHLAQIKYLYPDAFVFSQMKMRNYGSTSKTDYFQLVIAPNVPQNDKLPSLDEDNVLKSGQSNAMNPQILIDRVQKFQTILLDRVKDEHDKFLKSLATPLIIPKEKVTRWHPEFDLEGCPDIPLGHLPQPPNVEKYSSARDILSTARNLFNCATPLERAMEKYEAKLAESKKDKEENSDEKIENNNESEKAATSSEPPPTDNLLKGIPKSLLERIRAKQAAKAMDAMTRRPSQDQEAVKYRRLPDLSRHLRNVFITEKKSVLTLEIIIKKIQNSFRTSLTPLEIEDHLKLLAKECPEWVGFHEVRKTLYIKISKDVELKTIVDKLEKLANDKS